MLQEFLNGELAAHFLLDEVVLNLLLEVELLALVWFLVLLGHSGPSAGELRGLSEGFQQKVLLPAFLVQAGKG